MKNVRYYRGLHYARRYSLVLDQPESPFWLAWIEELPGCQIDGRTRAEASVHLEELFVEYIEAKLAWGSRIPEPKRAKAKKATSSNDQSPNTWVIRGTVYKTRVPKPNRTMALA